MTDSSEVADQLVNLKYSPAVMAAIEEILPSKDPFDAADFNPVDYINNRFPAEQSLQLLDDALDEMKAKLAEVDEQTRSLVHHLAMDTKTGQESLLYAEEAICQLSSRFQDIKLASSESEQRVRAITRDIRQLDTGKRNLTASITALNHLQMLAEGVHKLQRLSAARQYGELAPLLQGVLHVLQHLERYTHVPQVKQLADQVTISREQLERQILAEFRSTSGAMVAPSQQLAEACLVADVLDSSVRCSIVRQVVQHQLAEYRAVFAASERDGWLTSVDLRKKWFLRTAVDFDRTLAQMFPPNWKVPAHLAYAFCRVTQGQLAQAMSLRSSELDSNCILQAHKVLADLESLIAQKYGNSFSREDLIEGVWEEEEGGTGGREAARSGDTMVGHGSVLPLHSVAISGATYFEGAITSCFLPHLHFYLNTVDKRLGEQMDRFSAAIREYRFERLEEEESNVIPCCGELFTLYKNILVEFLRVSGGGYGMPGLTLVFQRRLREFGTRVLRQALPGASQGITAMPKDVRDIGALIAQVQSLLVREGEGVRLTPEELVRVCAVLVSAEYCGQMTAKLQAKLQQKWEQAPQQPQSVVGGAATAAAAVPAGGLTTGSVSLSSEEDLFHAVLAQCILLLVGHVETLCDTSLAGMPKMNWLLDQTGDQSPYVSQLTAHLRSTVPLVRYNLHTSRKYFTRFCDKLAASICTKFTQQVFRCRPINGAGCEQLLLDCHALKASLLSMPVMGAAAGREPPVSYTRMVTKSLARPELLLQVVMGEYSSTEQLLDKSIRLLPDLPLTDFQKVLEMRGIKEKATLLEAYRQRTASGVGEVASGPAVAGRREASAATPDHELSKIAKLEKMLKARRLI